MEICKKCGDPVDKYKTSNGTILYFHIGFTSKKRHLERKELGCINQKSND